MKGKQPVIDALNQAARAELQAICQYRTHRELRGQRVTTGCPSGSRASTWKTKSGICVSSWSGSSPSRVFPTSVTCQL